MATDLGTLLGLVGNLRDDQGEDTARERFRVYLREHIRKSGLHSAKAYRLKDGPLPHLRQLLANTTAATCTTTPEA